MADDAIRVSRLADLAHPVASISSGSIPRADRAVGASDGRQPVTPRPVAIPSTLVTIASS